MSSSIIKGEDVYLKEMYAIGILKKVKNFYLPSSELFFELINNHFKVRRNIDFRYTMKLFLKTMNIMEKNNIIASIIASTIFTLFLKFIHIFF